MTSKTKSKRYNIYSRVDGDGYDVVVATESKYHPPGRYATQDEARAAADRLTEKSAKITAQIAANPKRESSLCCDCGDDVPLTPSPRGMICEDCRQG